MHTIQHRVYIKSPPVGILERALAALTFTDVHVGTHPQVTLAFEELMLAHKKEVHCTMVTAQVCVQRGQGGANTHTRVVKSARGWEGGCGFKNAMHRGHRAGGWAGVGWPRRDGGEFGGAVCGVVGRVGAGRV